MATKIITQGENLNNRMEVLHEWLKILENDLRNDRQVWYSKYYDAKWCHTDHGEYILLDIKDYGIKEAHIIVFGDTFEEVRDEVIRLADKLTDEHIEIVKKHMNENYEYYKSRK